MIRITIHSVRKNGVPEFPLRVDVKRFPVICSMKDTEVQAVMDEFAAEHPDRTVVGWHKDILRYSPAQEAVEMAAEIPYVSPPAKPEPDVLEEPM